MSLESRPSVDQVSRRGFLKEGAAVGAGLAGWAWTASAAAQEAAAPTKSPNERFTIAVMGLGRGMAHVGTTLQLGNCDIAYVCDVDQRRIDRALPVIAQKQTKMPQAPKDFRRILDDGSVDAVFIATCNHWHAPAAILACAAGKHVYVEKPGSHNAREGELVVQAARKHGRTVQMGNQRRSYPLIRRGIERLKEGVIGQVTFARCYYDNARASIGKGKPAPVPETLDWNLWQGPAPERPYKDNLVHYNWHWHWHWGGGELANNGIHALDLARWGLGVDYPRRVVCNGGRYHYDDDQETPDTSIAVFDFGGKGCAWDGSSCNPRRPEQHRICTFYGEKGMLTLVDDGYIVTDPAGKEIESDKAPGSDKPHVSNFLQCIRSGERPNSDIEECQKSTLLCHLGNIAYRLGRTVDFDPQTKRIVGLPEADALWSREYRKGFEPKV